MFKVWFATFIDDDFIGARDFETIFIFLYEHYFLRLIQVKLLINPKKYQFFAAEVSILGHTKAPNSIRPSQKRLNAFAKQLVLEDKGELKRFTNALLQINKFIPSRANKSKFLYTTVKKKKVQKSRKGKLVYK